MIDGSPQVRESTRSIPTAHNLSACHRLVRSMWEESMGGIWRFTPLPGNQAGPGTWESLNTSSLSTILAQGVGIHPTNSTILLEGSQDNGIALRTSSSRTWTYVHGGDASRVRFDPAPQNG